jgi:hypothetical protein
MPGRKIQHLAAMIEGQHLCDHKERIGALPSDGRERRLEIERIAVGGSFASARQKLMIPTPWLARISL